MVNARYVKPLDEELIYNLAKKHPIVVTVEDGAIMGGFGSAVLEFMAETGLTAQCIALRLGIEDHFVEHGTQQELYKLCGYDTPSIVGRVLKAYSSKPASTGAVVNA